MYSYITMDWEGEYNSEISNRKDLNPRTSVLNVPDFLENGVYEADSLSPTWSVCNRVLIHIERTLRARGLFKVRSSHRKISDIARTKKFPILEMSRLALCCFKKREPLSSTTTLTPAQRLGLV